MNKAEKLELLEKWYSKLKNADLWTDKWITLGVSVDSFEPIFELVEQYTKLVADKLNTDSDWLFWYLYDLPLLKDDHPNVTINNVDYTVSTLEELLEVIEAENEQAKE